jgi:hypothetical protein
MALNADTTLTATRSTPAKPDEGALKMRPFEVTQ